MFFTLHPERKIGYKKLSEADLGLSPDSHQTHIGLYERKNMLSFLKNEDTTTAILIYNNYFDVLKCNFERIQNPDGTFRSPKISLGDKDENTVVRKIREFAQQNPKRDYYLVWFALENNELLFWLIDNSSSDYAKLKDFFPTENTVYDTSEIIFTPLIKFIESKIDELSIGLQEDLEIISQTSAKSEKYRTLDIEKAQERFKITGRTGEELINEYLEMQKSKNLISEFEWVNKSKESGKPFDFVVKPKNDREKYIDVKTTQFKFEQPLMFSDGEIDFINSIEETRYSVYRVFSLREDIHKFRKCFECFNYMKNLESKISNFKTEIQSASSDVRGIKLAVPPTSLVFKRISEDILLEGVTR